MMTTDSLREEAAQALTDLSQVSTLATQENTLEETAEKIVKGALDLKNNQVFVEEEQETTTVISTFPMEGIEHSMTQSVTVETVSTNKVLTNNLSSSIPLTCSSTTATTTATTTTTSTVNNMESKSMEAPTTFAGLGRGEGALGMTQVIPATPNTVPHHPFISTNVPTLLSETPGMSPLNSANSEQQEALLLVEQFRFCTTLLRHIKKRKDAFPFLVPVDPVLLNIPTYFDIVEKPMDLSTVEKKLVSNSYKSPQEYVDDMILIFSNCYKFNGMEAQVSAMGKSLEKHFLKEFEKLPKQIKDKKKKPSRPSTTHSANGDGVSRPRREVPFTPKEIAAPTEGLAGARSTRKLTPQLKFASSLLRDLMKKHYAPYNIAFLQPVDPDALGIPQYRDIIKNPMDLSTIRRKLDMGQYKDGDEFESHIRLMFNNCYTFNAPGSEVYSLGKELEAVFDRKWNERPPPGDYEEKPRRSSQAFNSAFDLSDVSDDDDDDADAQHIEMLKTQVQLLTTQLTLLTEKRAKRKHAKAMSSANKKRKAPSKPSGPLKQKSFASATPTPAGRSFEAEVEPQELTYEQKRELSENINVLTQDQLARVLQIIRENTHIDESQGEEIELDIDSLDKKTLWKLYNYVSKHTRKVKKSKTEGPARASSSSGSSSGSDSDDSGSNSD